MDWTVAQNGSDFAASTGSEIRFTPDDDGIYLVTLTATDQFDQSETVEHAVNVANVAPTPSISGPTRPWKVTSSHSPQRPPIRRAITTSCHSTGRSPRNTTPFASGSGAEISFTPDDDGVFEITLTAADEDGGSADVSHTVTISNVSPTANITGPTSGQEGSAVSLIASAADPGGDNDPLTFTWSITKRGEPFATGVGPAITFTPDDDGQYVVVLTVADDDGALQRRRTHRVYRQRRSHAEHFRTCDGGSRVHLSRSPR